MRELFCVRAIEIKSTRRGQRRELACRWCKRRGYHLSRCPRAADLRSLSELEIAARYLLELAGASSRTDARSRMN